MERDKNENIRNDDGDIPCKETKEELIVSFQCNQGTPLFYKKKLFEGEKVKHSFLYKLVESESKINKIQGNHIFLDENVIYVEAIMSLLKNEHSMRFLEESLTSSQIYHIKKLMQKWRIKWDHPILSLNGQYSMIVWDKPQKKQRPVTILQIKKNTLECFIHYKGCKEKWDEWISLYSDRVVKIENIEYFIRLSSLALESTFDKSWYDPFIADLKNFAANVSLISEIDCQEQFLAML